MLILGVVCCTGDEWDEVAKDEGGGGSDVLIVKRMDFLERYSFWAIFHANIDSLGGRGERTIM